MLHTDWQLVTGWPSGVTHRLGFGYKVAELCNTETGSQLQGGRAVLHRDWQLVTKVT